MKRSIRKKTENEISHFRAIIKPLKDKCIFAEKTISSIKNNSEHSEAQNC